MEAYKCDRCGKLFEKPTASILGIDKRTSVCRDNWEPQDLCPECKKSLEEWWKTGKEQKNGNI